MKISTGWKIIFCIFALIGLFQVYELGFTLMNKPDSYLANLGLVIFGATIASTIYCFIQGVKNCILFIQEQEEREEGRK